MKTLKSGFLIALLTSLNGCEQALVQFDEQTGHDLAASDDMAAGVDLAGHDLLAQGDLAGTGDGGYSDGGANLAPQVMSVTPNDQVLGVAVFRTPTATFNKAMDPMSISNLSFRLREQGAVQLVSGTVSYSSATATAIFKPSSPLLVDTIYEATLTTAAKDTLGTPLAANYVWTFRTSTQVCGMSPVLLGSAGSFGAFASTTITSSGPTIVNGDIGVSPGTSTAIVGFGPSPGVAGPGIVNGTQRTDPDPAAAQAKADLTTAYNDAAGRSLCFITIADGELGGKTLTPGLYRSGISSFAISASDLTLDALGDSGAVFIIQTSSSTLTVANGSKVILAGGARASNVFWSVGTQTTIGTTASVKGTILSGTSIAMGTGAQLEGRALANAAVNLLSNTISVPAP